jgi:hypothetical protein
VLPELELPDDPEPLDPEPLEPEPLEPEPLDPLPPPVVLLQPIELAERGTQAKTSAAAKRVLAIELTVASPALE